MLLLRIILSLKHIRQQEGAAGKGGERRGIAQLVAYSYISLCSCEQSSLAGR
jgi:hypothetical protein